MHSVEERLANIRHVALDMDGTIYLGSRLFDCTAPFLATLQRLGIGFSFLTNNSSHTRQQYVARLAALGLPVEREAVYTSTLATAEYLRTALPQAKRIFLLATPAVRAEFSEFGFQIDWSADETPDAVIVAFDRTLDYDRLCQAAWWIKQGRPFIATHPDKICPTDQPVVLMDCGAMCAALQTATGIAPTVVGKPHPRMLAGLCDRYSLKIDQIAMVGDRLSTDIALARRSGALGVLVLSGEATRADAAASEWQPDLICRNLAELQQHFARSGAQEYV